MWFGLAFLLFIIIMCIGSHQEYKADQENKEKTILQDLAKRMTKLEKSVNNLSEKIDNISESKYTKNKKNKNELH